jgi:hypothetical protein
MADLFLPRKYSFIRLVVSLRVTKSSGGSIVQKLLWMSNVFHPFDVV